MPAITRKMEELMNLDQKIKRPSSPILVLSGDALNIDQTVSESEQ